jgi:flagellar protein FlaI
MQEIASYSYKSDSIPVNIRIVRDPKEFVLFYNLELPKIEEATRAALDKLKGDLIKKIPVRTGEVFDIVVMEDLRKKFTLEASKLIKEEIRVSDELALILASFTINEMLGLGDIEILLDDDDLEEIVINNAKENVWVYHKKHGWLKTNLGIPSEKQIENFAASIGRRVGRTITTLDPLMDAHLVTGDRVSATLFPISTKGNTLVIRKFRRRPWSITDLIKNKTVDTSVMSLLWLAVQYELSVIVSGGTATGKTTFLNSLMSFVPPNQRIISIEDTRELSLPRFLHWVPLTTREPNPEGKGEITMLELMIKSLRMRPDRIVVGEIRRQEEAEVLFEALHTGHSVYATLHADTAEQTIRRMISPPINVPPSMLEAIDLVAVMFRNRRLGIRRLFEVAEVVPTVGVAEVEGVKPNIIFKWKPRVDEIVKEGESVKLMDKLLTYTGMSSEEIKEDLEKRKLVLDWLVNRDVSTIDAVGKLISLFYIEEEKIVGAAREDKDPRIVAGELR